MSPFLLSGGLIPLLFYLLVAAFPIAVPAQGNQEIAEILELAIESPILRPYLPTNAQRLPEVDCLITGPYLPSRLPLVVFDDSIRVCQRAEDSFGIALQVKKFRWKYDKARVVLAGPPGFRGSFRFQWMSSRWYLTKAHVRGIAIRQGKRQRSWDFLW